jgi:hypothetical protein
MTRRRKDIDVRLSLIQVLAASGLVVLISWEGWIFSSPAEGGERGAQAVCHACHGQYFELRSARSLKANQWRGHRGAVRLL